MTFIDKIKQPVFWSNVLKIAIPFFIFVTVISLLLNSSSAIFSGDFTSVSKVNFTNGKWINFFGIKVVISVLYGIYTTNKKMR